jgi:hypothetical protein
VAVFTRWIHIRTAANLKSTSWRARRGKIGRDVTVALAIKLALLAALCALISGPAYRPPSDSAATATAVAGAIESGVPSP